MILKSDNKISEAIKYLKDDMVIGLPTETVYGLAGNIYSKKAINRIFETKERPFFDPLIIHVASTEQAKEISTYWDDTCEILAKNFWPGPMTLILPKSDSIDDVITSGLDTVGIRLPSHPLAIQLIEKFGPVAAPSANKFKKTSPTSAEHVDSEFPNVPVLDGGECEIGIESTILGIQKEKVIIYRPGMLDKKKIEAVLKSSQIKIPVVYQESPVAPGHLKHHYMPKLPIITEFKADSTDHIPHELMSNQAVWKLESDPVIVARNLYKKFREFDKNQYSSIYLILPKITDGDAWKGVLNRIEKASTYFIGK